MGLQASLERKNKASTEAALVKEVWIGWSDIAREDRAEGLDREEALKLTSLR